MFCGGVGWGTILPNNKIFDNFNLKIIADDKMNET